MKTWVSAVAVMLLAGGSWGQTIVPIVTRSSDVSATMQKRSLTFKQASSYKLRWTFTQGTTAMSFPTNATVLFSYAPSSGAWVVNKAGSIELATNGQVSVTFTPSNLNTNGHYNFDLVVSHGSDELAYGYGELELLTRVNESADALTTGPVVDWSDFTNYYYTGTHGPYRAGSGVTATTNSDGSVTMTVTASGLGALTKVSAGTNMTVSTGGSTATVHHANTSSQASTTSTNGVVPQKLTLDTDGHVTAIATADLDNRYYTETEADAKYALDTLTLTAGDGLTGGGDLSANRSFAVDSSVVRTSRAVNVSYPLTGGGYLTGDVTVGLSTTWSNLLATDVEVTAATNWLAADVAANLVVATNAVYSDVTALIPSTTNMMTRDGTATWTGTQNADGEGIEGLASIETDGEFDIRGYANSSWTPGDAAFLNVLRLGQRTGGTPAAWLRWGRVEINAYSNIILRADNGHVDITGGDLDMNTNDVVNAGTYYGTATNTLALGGTLATSWATDAEVTTATNRLSVNLGVNLAASTTTVWNAVIGKSYETVANVNAKTTTVYDAIISKGYVTSGTLASTTATVYNAAVGQMNTKTTAVWSATGTLVTTATQTLASAVAGNLTTATNAVMEDVNSKTTTVWTAAKATFVEDGDTLSTGLYGPSGTASNQYVNRKQVYDLLENLSATVLFGSTTAHPVLSGRTKSLIAVTPTATWAVTNTLADGDNVIGHFFYTNTTTQLRAGVYIGRVYAVKTSGSKTATGKITLEVTDGGGTTNEIDVSAVSSAIGTSLTSYRVTTDLTTNITGTALYLGVKYTLTQTGTGGDAVIVTYGGEPYDTHLETPGIGPIADYVTAGDLTTATNRAAVNTAANLVSATQTLASAVSGNLTTATNGLAVDVAGNLVTATQTLASAVAGNLTAATNALAVDVAANLTSATGTLASAVAGNLTAATNALAVDVAGNLTSATQTLESAVSGNLTAATNRLDVNTAANLVTATNRLAVNVAANLVTATNRLASNVGANLTTATNNLMADVAYSYATRASWFATSNYWHGTYLSLPTTAPSTNAQVQWDATDDTLVTRDDGTNVVVGRRLITICDKTLGDPQNMQLERDAWPLTRIETDQYPHGLIVDRVYLSVATSATYKVDIEAWTTPTSGSCYSIVTNCTYATTENNFTPPASTNRVFKAGHYLFVDLPTNVVPWAHIKVIGHEPTQ